ncbi:MAG: hypothetical protein LBL49_06300 [Clostridiales Family XIII bacterium]|jgi:hypothetical protein|nr:hypothetical protein [Clostridiales Family XIII bacterium]
MKKRQLFIGVIIILALMSSATAPATAMTLKASNYISVYEATLSRTGADDVLVSYYVAAPQISDQLGVSGIIIERRSGSSWVTAATYSSSNYPAFMGNNCTTHSGTLTYDGVSGMEYRAKVTFFAKKGSGTDSRIFTTNSI